MRSRKRMTGVLFLVVAIIGFCACGSVSASDPDPQFFNVPAQEKRIAELEYRVKVLESALRKPLPMPSAISEKAAAPVTAPKFQPVKLNSSGAPMELAPAGKAWEKKGGQDSSEPWQLVDVAAPVQAVQTVQQQVFATPVRNWILNQTGVAVGTCTGPNCQKLIPATGTYRR